jgi:pimeloyl-ACP methyl ester carboxylesterase
MRSSVIAPALPGHAGGPPPLGTSYPEYFDDAADVLIEVCDQLDVESAVITGHSMGSAIAIRTAVKNPERVEGVMAIGGAARFVHAKDLGTAFRAIPGVLLTPAMTLSYLPLLRNLGAGSIVAIRDAAVDLARHDWKVVGGQAALACQNYDGRFDANRLRCPAFVIVFAEDKVVPAWTGYELADLAPNAEVLSIPGHHLSLWSEPKRVADAMTYGLQRIRQMQHKQQQSSNQTEYVQ